LTRFWLDALALGGGEQRFNADWAIESDGTSAHYAQQGPLWKRDNVW
jgi:hypothetical protein